MATKYVVLGGGVSAGYLAKAFVDHGFPKNSLKIISSDVVLPYERPALSKGYLADSKTRYPKFVTSVGEGGEAQTEEWYQRNGIEVMLNTNVLSIDLNAKKLRTTAGDVSFQKLILATGSDNIKPNWPGRDLRGVHILRELPDADSILGSFEYAKQTGGRAVIVGGGYIGIETASGCMQNDIPTTMVYPGNGLMDGFMPKELGLQYEQFYVERGVEMRKLMSVTGFRPNETGDRVKYVCLENGEEIECAFVIIGIGARPRVQLFKDLVAMHETGGALVDQYLQTSHPDVYAMGDVASFPDTLYNEGLHCRVEHVDNARKSAQHLAKVLYAKETGGELEPYRYLPYFYSREFDKSWKFYGRRKGDCFVAGTLFDLDNGLTAVWVDDRGILQGAFAESATDEEFQLLKSAVGAMISVNVNEIASARHGKDVLNVLSYAMEEAQPEKKQRPSLMERVTDVGKSAVNKISQLTEKMTST